LPKTTIAVGNKVGLHARPASLFVNSALKFPCKITVRNITADSKTANAKSILGILSLGVKQNHLIEIETEGDQAQEALLALTSLIEANFGEKLN
jgi:phosphotransferase system HPr (HPr) family protein